MSSLLKVIVIVVISTLGLSTYGQETLDLSQSHQIPNLEYRIDYPADWVVHEFIADEKDYAQLSIAKTDKDALEPLLFDPSPFNPLEHIRVSFSTESLLLIQERPLLSGLQEWRAFLEDSNLENLFRFGISSINVQALNGPEEIQILGVPALKARVSDFEGQVFGIVILGFVDISEMDEPNRVFLLTVEARSLEELNAFMPTWDAMEASLSIMASE